MQSLARLLKFIAKKYLDRCAVMILYDSAVIDEDREFIQELLTDYPLSFIQGTVEEAYRVREVLETSQANCVSYVLFLSDVMRLREVVGDQNEAKLVVVSRSSQWRLHEFLASEMAQAYVNLLVVAKSEKSYYQDLVVPYILYTHEMYIDGLGSSRPQLLTSWHKTKLSRPYINLYPKKMIKGFAGHRFIIAIAAQPPFTINRGKDTNDDIRWDGLEVRLIKILSEMLNFTRDYHEAKDASTLGPGDAVVKMMKDGKANLGVAGLYVTQDRAALLDMSHGHSQDCAVFISLTSTALPRYRAILGPFQWTVWLALTLVYLFAIFPITFSDKLTLKYLIKRPEEMENMFWYVFGTFTNAFSFGGTDSWGKSDKMSTRLFIGWYWVFTIIISACYTGSVIAFVTLPVYPTTVDTVQQLISGRFQVGTLDRGGWQYWFDNSTDKASEKLLKNLEYLPDVQSGLKNITTAFFWPYAFLGSRDQLEFIIRTNFTTSNKRSVLHISSQCFAPFSVSIAFPRDSVYKSILNSAILRSFQSGLVIKLKNDLQWDIMRSSTGKLLQANSVGKTRSLMSDDRSLTLADTQGMFLLLAVGFLLGGASLLSEWLGGCFNFCRGKGTRTSRLPSVATQGSDTSSIYPTPADFDKDKTDPEYQEVNGEVKFSDRDNICVVLVHKASPTEDLEDVADDNFENALTGEENIDNADKVSDVEENISEIFNFDHLFGEDSNSLINNESANIYTNDIVLDDEENINQNHA